MQGVYQMLISLLHEKMYILEQGALVCCIYKVFLEKQGSSIKPYKVYSKTGIGVPLCTAECISQDMGTFRENMLASISLY